MFIKCFTVGAFQVNTYLITDQATGLSAIIDTGESGELVEQLQKQSPAIQLSKILLTHGHLDHAGALTRIQASYDAETYLPRLEQPLFETLPVQGDWFGMPEFNRTCGRIDHWLDDGDVIELGQTRLRFISTPGHTPGQGCYYTDKEIFVGDTLFASSIGRTDLPMGDEQLMFQSLEKLMTLPGHLQVYSGHGPVTTLEQEKQTNPFLQHIKK